MALYQASDFSGFSDSYAVPAGVAEPLFSGSVDLILPTGTYYSASTGYTIYCSKLYPFYGTTKFSFSKSKGRRYDY